MVIWFLTMALLAAVRKMRNRLWKSQRLPRLQPGHCLKHPPLSHDEIKELDTGVATDDGSGTIQHLYSDGATAEHEDYEQEEVDVAEEEEE